MRSALIAEDKWPRLGVLGGALVAHPAPVYLVPFDVMYGITGFPIHRGVLASVTRLAQPQPDALWRQASCLAVLEGINDHENLGSIFRSAAALGYRRRASRPDLLRSALSALDSRLDG